ncbi:IS30 family transposase [Luteimicrobium subarcticum]|uniref:IS30 family transposase n=2 Tax=Luteimicrobium subarcticum TaxID=620910 RepID=A0A2M8WV78_9MICO|nr:IS30 family transposase [Luteimicrobium subarcticum]
MELRARGWSIAGAARETGVSRSTGKNWSRGHKVYRKGKVVGFVPPLDPLVVREISGRFLTQDERIEIADLRRAGLSIRAVGARIGRSPSTVSRELRRNVHIRGGYRPFDAHRRAAARRARGRLRRVETVPRLREVVGELLAQRWSPQQISRYLRAKHHDDPSMWLCHESIYQAIYKHGSTLVRPSMVAAPRRSPLRTGREHRRAHRTGQERRPRFAQPMLSVHDRGFEPTDRSQAGHWEGDLIIGKGQGSAIATLVERQTRTVRLVHLSARDAETVATAITARMADLPADLMRSITWDQGTEMAQHPTITATLGAPVYFCDSHSPWQRGSNENMNGVLRQYFPKGTDLSIHSPEHLLAVENEINTRPRLVLEDHTPAELFAALLASSDQSVLRR